MPDNLFGGEKTTETPTVTTQETVFKDPQLSSEEQDLLDLLKFISGVSGEGEGEGGFQFTETPQQKRLREFTESLQSQVSEDFVDPVLEAQIAGEKSQLEADLRRRLGPGFETSSSGIQALTGFDASANLRRQSARTGRQAGLTGNITELLQTGSAAQSESAGNIQNILSVLAGRKPTPISTRTVSTPGVKTTRKQPGLSDFVGLARGVVGG